MQDPYDDEEDEFGLIEYKHTDRDPLVPLMCLAAFALLCAIALT